MFGAAALLGAPNAFAKTKAEYRVTCKDGETSRPGKGACSGHGGIAADGKSGVICTDGSFSETVGRGACSGHGGMAKKGSVELNTDKQVKDRKETAKAQDRDLKDANKQDKAAAKENKKAMKEREKANKQDSKAMADKTTDDAAASVTCKDGTVKTGRLGCFGHGGVAKTDANPRETRTRGDKKTATGSGGDEPGGVTASPTGATAKCKDGMYSHATHHTGACSNHGGVAQWLDK